MADVSTITEPLALRLAGDLLPKSPIELMQHARSLIPMALQCDDPAVLSNAIDHAQAIDRRLRSFGVAKVDRDAAAELKLWSMWRLGRWLIESNFRGGTHAAQDGASLSVLDAILSSSGRSRCRQLGKLTRKSLENRIRQIRAAGDSPCLTKILRDSPNKPAWQDAAEEVSEPTEASATPKRQVGIRAELDLADLINHFEMLSQSLKALLDRARQSKRQRLCESSQREQLTVMQLDIDMVERYLQAITEELNRLTRGDSPDDVPGSGA